MVVAEWLITITFFSLQFGPIFQLINLVGDFMPQQNLPGFVAAIGNTPLIRLKGISDATGCDIYTVRRSS